MIQKNKRSAARRSYSDALKAEAVQMLLEGHSAESVAANLGISAPNLLSRWKAKTLQRSASGAAIAVTGRGRPGRGA